MASSWHHRTGGEEKGIEGRGEGKGEGREGSYRVGRQENCWGESRWVLKDSPRVRLCGKWWKLR